MSIEKIIKESIDQNQNGLKKALEEELRSRVALALEAKMKEEMDDEDDEDEDDEDEDDEDLNEAASFAGILAAHEYKRTGYGAYTGIGGTKANLVNGTVVTYNEADGRKTHKNVASLNRHLNALHDHEIKLSSIKEDIDEADDFEV